MPRACRAASTIAFACIGIAWAVSACGGGDSAEDPNTDAGSSGAVSTNVPPQKKTVCTSDADCKGVGKCKDVGASQKLCITAPSCAGGVGADTTCGGSKDCCETRLLPGGTYNRFNDKDFPATVSSFLLDTFEVTAGRFRAYVDATNGNLRANAPPAGAGAHPKVPNSGWRSEWTELLPQSRSDVDKMLGPELCVEGSNLDDYGTLTWWTSSLDAKVKSSTKDAQILSENTKQALDKKPLNCVPWYVLFAFCVWDGGRLPSDAEWGFAAAGGTDQRAFPWGSVATADLVRIGDNNQLSFVPVFTAGEKFMSASLWDKTLGANVFPDNYVYTYGGKFRAPTDNAAHLPAVGHTPVGNGKWGQSDLAGSMFEWMLDEGPIRPGNCDNCANVNWPSPDGRDPNAVKGPPDFHDEWFAGGARSVRGGAWDNALGLANAQTKIEVEWYTSYPVQRTYRSLGGRCARDL